MKNQYLFSALLLFLISSLEIAQQNLLSIYEGIEVSWDITSGDDVVLNDGTQYLTKRSTKKFNHNYTEYNSYTTAYAIEALFLEFKSQSGISSFLGQVATKSKEKKTYVLKLYDMNNELIYISNLHSDRFSFYGEKDDQSTVYYSLEIGNLPAILLEDVSRLDITMVEYRLY